jgi:hypothetical protein
MWFPALGMIPDDKPTYRFLFAIGEALANSRQATGAKAARPQIRARLWIRFRRECATTEFPVFL